MEPLAPLTTPSTSHHRMVLWGFQARKMPWGRPKAPAANLRERPQGSSQGRTPLTWGRAPSGAHNQAAEGQQSSSRSHGCPGGDSAGQSGVAVQSLLRQHGAVGGSGWCSCQSFSGSTGQCWAVVGACAEPSRVARGSGLSQTRGGCWGHSMEPHPANHSGTGAGAGLGGCLHGAREGSGLLLNHFGQKLFTFRSISHKGNRFLYKSFQAVVICWGRRKRNETREQILVQCSTPEPHTKEMLHEKH